MKMYDSWLEVPYRVGELYVKYASDAATLVQQPTTTPVGWVLNTDEVGPVFISKYAFNIMPALEQVPKYIGAGMDSVQKAVGGPNPLTATLLGGALGAGLGYGGGWLAHKLAPDYVGEDAPGKWALAGGGLGGLGPALLHGVPNVAELGWRGLFQPSRYQGRQGGAETLRTLMSEDPTDDAQAELHRAEAHDARNPIADTLKAACDIFGIVPVDDEFTEKAADIAGAALRPVPTDQWGRAIMYDPFLDDQSKATASGLPMAAAAAKGSNWVTPMDIARVASNTALGRATGWGIGQLASAFFGFTPQVREGLQQAGTLAGAVRGVLGMLQ